MSKPFKPRRGKRTTAIAKNVVLQKGEIFFEVPSTGAGTGEGKLFMGDGTTTYENLPSFLDNSGKVDKVSNPTTGALTALDASGNITDTGIKFDVTSPTTGQSLIYDATNGTWVNGENFPEPIEITYEAFLLLPEAQKESGNYLVTGWPGVNMTEDMAALRRDVNALSANKADKVSSATAGDLAGLDSNGNLTDSGVKSANLVTADSTTHVLSGALIANATETANLGVKQVRNIYCGTTDLTPGVSILPAGDIYIYYEET